MKKKTILMIGILALFTFSPFLEYAAARLPPEPPPPPSTDPLEVSDAPGATINYWEQYTLYWQASSDEFSGTYDITQYFYGTGETTILVSNRYWDSNTLIRHYFRNFEPGNYKITITVRDGIDEVEQDTPMTVVFPQTSDHDNDGLYDWDEYTKFGTSFYKYDTDSDTWGDKVEIEHYTNPNDPTDGDRCFESFNSVPIESLPTNWEWINSDPELISAGVSAPPDWASSNLIQMWGDWSCPVIRVNLDSAFPNVEISMKVGLTEPINNENIVRMNLYDDQDDFIMGLLFVDGEFHYCDCETTFSGYPLLDSIEYSQLHDIEIIFRNTGTDFKYDTSIIFDSIEYECGLVSNFDRISEILISVEDGIGYDFYIDDFEFKSYSEPYFTHYEFRENPDIYTIMDSGPICLKYHDDYGAGIQIGASVSYDSNHWDDIEPNLHGIFDNTFGDTYIHFDAKVFPEFADYSGCGFISPKFYIDSMEVNMKVLGPDGYIDSSVIGQESNLYAFDYGNNEELEFPFIEGEKEIFLELLIFLMDQLVPYGIFGLTYKCYDEAYGGNDDMRGVSTSEESFKWYYDFFNPVGTYSGCPEQMGLTIALQPKHYYNEAQSGDVFTYEITYKVIFVVETFLVTGTFGRAFYEVRQDQTYSIIYEE